MKVLHQIKFPQSIGANRFIYDGYKQAWLDLGHNFFPLTENDDLEESLKKIKPDLFFASLDYLNIPSDIGIIKKARKLGIKVFVGVGHRFDQDASILSILKDRDFADIYYGEKEIEAMKNFKKIIGKDYHLIPHAANKSIHFPTKALEKYKYDIVFLGAKLPLKRWFFNQVLLPLKKDYNVGIFGPYWTKKDQVFRLGQRVSREVHLNGLSNFINRLRITIPLEEENALYSSAKICLNFHERNNDGSEASFLVNERTFKICACGGFQICDYLPALKRYFNENEIVSVKLNREEWLNKIKYYLNHPNERRKIQEAGTRRALRDHTYHNRVNKIIKIYKKLQI